MILLALVTSTLLQQQESQMLESLNSLRKEYKLEPFTVDARLNEAAKAHSSYMVKNKEMGHVESASKPGFTGAASWDRSKKFGFPGLCLEAVAWNFTDMRLAARSVFNSPYHRINFLQEGAPAIGIACDKEYVTVNTGLTSKATLIMSPFPDSKTNPVSTAGPDIPLLLNVHKAKGEVGYPILFGFFTPQLSPVQIKSVSLTGPEGDVACYLNTPQNDTLLRMNAILTPKKPLKHNAKYTVKGELTTAAGVKIAKTWSFTTG